MKDLLSPQPAALLIKIVLLAFKSAINLLVLVIFFLDQWFQNKSAHDPNVGLEPRYVRIVLRLASSNEKEALLGDEIEHYGKICDRLGKQRGDQWLFDETVESLLRLILRREFISHVRTALGNWFRTFSLQTRTIIREGTTALFLPKHCIVSTAQQKTISLALVALTLTSSILLYRAPIYHVENSEELRNEPISSEEITHRNSDEQPLPNNAKPINRREVAIGSEPKRAKKRHPNTESLLAYSRVILTPYNGTRELEAREKDLRKVQNKRIYLSLRLPPGIKRGLFQVTLEDLQGNHLATFTASSADGKYAHARLDMKRFAFGEYRLLMWQIGQKNEDVPTSIYRFLLTRDDAQ